MKLSDLHTIHTIIFGYCFTLFGWVPGCARARASVCSLLQRARKAPGGGVLSDADI